MRGEYRGEYAVIGPPGTGKTTFLARQIAQLVDAGATPAVCSLTRTAAHEIASRVADSLVPDARIGTLHSLAWRATRAERDDDERVITPRDAAEFSALHPHLAFAIDGKSRAEDSPLAECGEYDDAANLPGQAIYARVLMLRHAMTPAAEWDDEAIAFYRAYRAFCDERRLVDFTDMLEDALILAASGEDASPYETLLIDEAQDFSRLEMSLARAWTRDGALFIVGDPLQSLYAWRGATPEVFTRTPRERRKILSRSWRVPRTVRDAALAWIRANHTNDDVTTEYEYRPRTEEDGAEAVGSVETSAVRLSDAAAVAELVEEVERSGSSVMIAAQCAYMLRPIIDALRNAGVLFANPWRPDNGEWNPIASRGVSTYERVHAITTAARERRLWSFAELATWTPLVARVLRRGSKKYIEARAKTERIVDASELRDLFADPYEAELVAGIVRSGNTRAILAWLEERASKTARKRIEYAIRVEKKRKEHGEPRVFVGTVHSFKGAEADTVILFPDISRAAARDIDTRGAPARDAVARTVYVGMTRAKERLILAAPMNERRAAIWHS